MERNYTRTWLVGLAVLLSGAAVAQAQEPPPVRMLAEGPTIDQTVQPVGPVEGGTVADAQLFQPPDLTQIGTYPELNYGPYFQYERLYWSLHQPSTTIIGDQPTAILNDTPNDNDTGFMNAGFVWGNRFDFGYLLEDNTGWGMSVLKTNTQFNTLIDAFSTNVSFAATPGTLNVLGVGTPSIGGNPGVPGVPTNPNVIPAYQVAYPSLSNVEFRNFTRMVGVELMKSYRYPVQHNGGVWTVSAGVRFFQLHDRFDATGTAAASSFLPTQVSGEPNPLPAGGASTATPPAFTATPAETEQVVYGAAPIAWDLGIDNNVVGPQIAIGYEMENERWTVGSSIRAMFGANFQNASEYGYTGGPVTNTVSGAGVTEMIGTTNQPSNNFFNKSNSIEFAPLGELRLDGEYKITNNFSLKVGYTGIVVTGIGRAANRIVYALPDMGIQDGGNKEHFFANGVNFGFELNR